MNYYDALVTSGDGKRNQYDLSGAIKDYLDALWNIGGPRDTHCRQMIGVCYRLLGRPESAVAWFMGALLHATPYEKGNIYRDWGETESLRGNFDKAEGLLDWSLELLPLDQYPGAYAATLGFKARNYQRQGQISKAVQCYSEADQILSRHGNRRTELYNKLHYASCLSQARRPLLARRIALKALRLARMRDSEGKLIGTPEHRRRAIIILVGGYRADRLRAKLAHH